MFAKRTSRSKEQQMIGTCCGTETALDGLVERSRMPGALCREERPRIASGDTHHPDLFRWLDSRKSSIASATLMTAMNAWHLQDSRSPEVPPTTALKSNLGPQ